MSANPCRCWTQPANIHAGHCCFRAGDLSAYQRGQSIPCGHDPLGLIIKEK